MIKKGDTVKILPKWMDVGDETLVWVAVCDEEKGFVDISPTNFGFALPPVHTVDVKMLEGGAK